jgi:predicted  nucleic acid-binding Zn-ribbon protein
VERTKTELQRLNLDVDQKRQELLNVNYEVEAANKQLQDRRKSVAELGQVAEREHQHMTGLAQRVQALRAQIVDAEETLRRAQVGTKAETDKQKQAQIAFNEQLVQLQVSCIRI